MNKQDKLHTLNNPRQNLSLMELISAILLLVGFLLVLADVGG